MTWGMPHQSPSLEATDVAALQGLVGRVLEGARLLQATPLAPDAVLEGATHKGTGYGAPLRLDVEHEGSALSLVLHTATANEFGHDRRADRAAEVLLAADTFELVERHARVLDFGAYKRGGGSVSLRETGEFYLLTTWAEGRPYAEDLRGIAESGEATARDLARVDALAGLLLRLHAERLDEPAAYVRHVRDLVGGGEGVFGIVDAYPAAMPGVSAERLLRIQELCVSWKERLKTKVTRLRRIHGDYHPFNVLFDDRGELSLLDTSRGSAGDAADDLTALSVNYLFFALEKESAWARGFAPLWYRFWSVYGAGSNDDELAEVVAPYFAWRSLVLACPRWYPDARAQTRDRLLAFAERLLAGQRFSPELAEEIFR
jgi:hypothetical protein